MDQWKQDAMLMAATEKTMRDEIAIAVLPDFLKAIQTRVDITLKQACVMAYQVADAMMQERLKGWEQ